MLALFACLPFVAAFLLMAAGGCMKDSEYGE